jgi:hypothetical protein
MSRYLNMVRQPLLTLGVGTTIQLDTTAPTGFATMAGAGALDQKTYSYIIVDGNNWEIHTQETYTVATRTFTRGTPDLSLISGTAGTTKIDIQAGAFIRILASAKDLEYFFRMRNIRVVTGATDTVLADDSGAMTVYNRATAIAVTLPQAGTAGFESRWSNHVINIGAGEVTITPTTSTIGGAATLVLKQWEHANIVSDGTNYYAPVSAPPLYKAATWTSAQQLQARTNMGIGPQQFTPVSLNGLTTTSFSIPAGCRQFTIGFWNLSGSSTGLFYFQLADAGGLEGTGYLGAMGHFVNGNFTSVGNGTTGMFIMFATNAANVLQGSATFTLINATNNTWICSGTYGFSDAAAAGILGWSKSLSAQMTSVTLGITAGTFDSGEAGGVYHPPS